MAKPPRATLTAVKHLLAQATGPNRELLSDEQYEQAIEGAVAEYSRDRPLTTVVEVAGADTEWYRLDTITGWVDGYSLIERVTYPDSATAASTSDKDIDPELYRTYRTLESGAVHVYLQFLADQPATGSTIELTFSTTHSHDATSNTVLAGDTQGFYALCAAHACNILATIGVSETIGRLGADVAASGSLADAARRQGKEFRDIYERSMGINVDESPPAAVGRRRRWQSVPAIERSNRWITHGE